MKIEMGESAVYSYLKHCKKCLMVENNWKPATEWTIHNYDKLEDLYTAAKEQFPRLFGTQNLAQLLRQAEIDSVGIESDHLYMIDVAFHEFGLRYKDNNAVISKKLLRSVFCMLAFFNQEKGEIIFASPKINPSPLRELKENLEKLQIFLNENKISITLKLLANDDFTHEIITPLQNICKNNSDTNELFLRSLQLLNVCGCK